MAETAEKMNKGKRVIVGARGGFTLLNDKKVAAKMSALPALSSAEVIA